MLWNAGQLALLTINEKKNGKEVKYIHDGNRKEKNISITICMSEMNME